MALEIDYISPAGGVRNQPQDRMVRRSIPEKHEKSMSAVADGLTVRAFDFEPELDFTNDDFSDFPDPLDGFEYTSDELAPLETDLTECLEDEVLAPLTENEENELISMLRDHQPLAEHHCEHVATLPQKLKKMPKTVHSTCQYTRCQSKADCSVCLMCAKVFCGENGDQHMGLHMIKKEDHCVCLFLKDLSFYCIHCDTMLEADRYPKLKEYQDSFLELKNQHKGNAETTLPNIKAPTGEPGNERNEYDISSPSGLSFTSSESSGSVNGKRKFGEELPEGLFD